MGNFSISTSPPCIWNIGAASYFNMVPDTLSYTGWEDFACTKLYQPYRGYVDLSKPMKVHSISLNPTV